MLGIFNSKILSPLNKIWFKFGIFLGKIISPIVMGIVFFIVVTPIVLLMRLLKKDLLNLKFTNEHSYWIDKNDPKTWPALSRNDKCLCQSGKKYKHCHGALK